MNEEHDGGISTAELARWMTRLELGVTSINARLDSLPYVRAELYEAEKLSLGNRIGEVEDSVKRAYRTAVTGLLFPIIVGIIVALATISVTR